MHPLIGRVKIVAALPCSFSLPPKLRELVSSMDRRNDCQPFANVWLRTPGQCIQFDSTNREGFARVRPCVRCSARTEKGFGRRLRQVQALCSVFRFTNGRDCFGDLARFLFVASLSVTLTQTANKSLELTTQTGNFTKCTTMATTTTRCLRSPSPALQSAT